MQPQAGDLTALGNPGEEDALPLWVSTSKDGQGPLQRF